MPKKKVEEATYTGQIDHKISNSTYKKLMNQYKRENEELLKKIKKLQEELSRCQDEVDTLRKTNQQLIKRRY